MPKRQLQNGTLLILIQILIFFFLLPQIACRLTNYQFSDSNLTHKTILFFKKQVCVAPTAAIQKHKITFNQPLNKKKLCRTKVKLNKNLTIKYKSYKFTMSAQNVSLTNITEHSKNKHKNLHSTQEINASLSSNPSKRPSNTIQPLVISSTYPLPETSKNISSTSSHLEQKPLCESPPKSRNLFSMAIASTTTNSSPRKTTYNKELTNTQIESQKSISSLLQTSNLTLTPSKRPPTTPGEPNKIAHLAPTEHEATPLKRTLSKKQLQKESKSKLQNPLITIFTNIPEAHTTTYNLSDPNLLQTTLTNYENINKDNGTTSNNNHTNETTPTEPSTSNSSIQPHLTSSQYASSTPNSNLLNTCTSAFSDEIWSDEEISFHNLAQVKKSSTKKTRTTRDSYLKLSDHRASKHTSTKKKSLRRRVHETDELTTNQSNSDSNVAKQPSSPLTNTDVNPAQPGLPESDAKEREDESNMNFNNTNSKYINSLTINASTHNNINNNINTSPTKGLEPPFSTPSLDTLTFGSPHSVDDKTLQKVEGQKGVPIEDVTKEQPTPPCNLNDTSKVRISSVELPSPNTSSVINTALLDEIKLGGVVVDTETVGGEGGEAGILAIRPHNKLINTPVVTPACNIDTLTLIVEPQGLTLKQSNGELCMRVPQGGTIGAHTLPDQSNLTYHTSLANTTAVGCSKIDVCRPASFTTLTSLNITANSTSPSTHSPSSEEEYESVDEEIGVNPHKYEVAGNATFQHPQNDDTGTLSSSPTSNTEQQLTHESTVTKITTNTIGPPKSFSPLSPSNPPGTHTNYDENYTTIEPHSITDEYEYVIDFVRDASTNTIILTPSTTHATITAEPSPSQPTADFTTGDSITTNNLPTLSQLPADSTTTVDSITTNNLPTLSQLPADSTTTGDSITTNNLPTLSQLPADFYYWR